MVPQWSYRLASSICIGGIIFPSFKKKPQNHLIHLGILMVYLLVQGALFGTDTLLFIRLKHPETCTLKKRIHLVQQRHILLSREDILVTRPHSHSHFFFNELQVWQFHQGCSGRKFLLWNLNSLPVNQPQSLLEIYHFQPGLVNNAVLSVSSLLFQLPKK